MIIDFSELDYRLKAIVKRAKKDGAISNYDNVMRFGMVLPMSTAFLNHGAAGAGIGALAGALLGQGFVSLSNHLLKKELSKYYKLGKLTDNDINAYLNTGKLTPKLSNILREIQGSVIRSENYRK